MESDFTAIHLQVIRDKCFQEADGRMDAMHKEWREDLDLVAKRDSIFHKEYIARVFD